MRPKGWKLNPLWVKYYEGESCADKAKAVIRRQIMAIQMKHSREMLEIQLGLRRAEF